MSKPNEKEALSGLADGAQPLAGPHAAASRRAGISPRSVPLAELHGHRVTIKLPIPCQVRKVKGTASYEPGVGLCVVLDDEAQSEVHLEEAAWTGRISRQAAKDSDYLIVLDAPAASPASR